MASNFPEDLDVFVNPTSNDPVTNPPHSEQHANANDAIVALQTKLGIDGSLDTTSVDYRLSTLEGIGQYISSVSDPLQVSNNDLSLNIGSGLVESLGSLQIDYDTLSNTIAGNGLIYDSGVISVVPGSGIIIYENSLSIDTSYLNLNYIKKSLGSDYGTILETKYSNQIPPNNLGALSVISGEVYPNLNYSSGEFSVAIIGNNGGKRFSKVSWVQDGTNGVAYNEYSIIELGPTLNVEVSVVRSTGGDGIVRLNILNSDLSNGIGVQGHSIAFSPVAP